MGSVIRTNGATSRLVPPTVDTAAHTSARVARNVTCTVRRMAPFLSTAAADIERGTLAAPDQGRPRAPVSTYPIDGDGRSHRASVATERSGPGDPHRFRRGEHSRPGLRSWVSNERSAPIQGAPTGRNLEGWRRRCSARHSRDVRRLRPAFRLAVVYFLAIAVFERVAPRSVVRAYQRANNKLQAHLMGLLPGWGVIETRGHRTGQVRRVPVGGRVLDGAFWLVAGDGRASAFVRNIDADPRVRVRFHGRWHDGMACVVEGDDAVARALRINPLNGAFVRIANTRSRMLSIRVELQG